MTRRDRPMIRPRRLGLSCPLAAAFAAPAFAQDGASATAAAGGQNYFEMFFLSGDPIGQGIIVLLVVLSAVSVALAVRFGLQYRRSTVVPSGSREQIEAMIADKKYREAIDFARSDASYLGRVTAAALSEASNGFGAMERAVEEAGDAHTTKMLRPLEYLNVLGQVAPMIGLFGTVYGMIVAFQKLVEAGGSPDPASLAAGISTALVTTLWGLIVAIPALAAYSVIRNRVDAFTSDGMLVAEEIIAPFKPSRRKKKSDGEAGGDGPSGGSVSGDGPSGGTNRPRATPKPD